MGLKIFIYLPLLTVGVGSNLFLTGNLNAENSMKRYCGLIGLHTTFGRGKNSVGELSQKAKELGYDFAIFTDEDTMLTEEEWKRLKEECARNSDPNFLALPGVEITTPEYHSYAFNFESWLNPEEKKSWFERFWAVWMHRLGPYGYNILVKAGETNLPPLQATLCGAVEAFAPDKDKFQTWLGYVRIRGVGIAATARAYSLEDLSRVKFKQYIWAKSLSYEDFRKAFPKCPPTGGSGLRGFVSNGPLIDKFVAVYKGREIWPGEHFWVKYGDKVIYRIKASSKYPITLVELYSGTQPIQRLSPQEKEINLSIPLLHTLDMPPWAKIEDARGRIAITSSIRTQARGGFYSWHCNDYMDSILTWTTSEGKSAHSVALFTNWGNWWGNIFGAQPRISRETGHHVPVLHGLEHLIIGGLRIYVKTPKGNHWITTRRVANGITYASKYSGIAFGRGENEWVEVESNWYVPLPRGTEDYALVWAEKKVRFKKDVVFASSPEKGELLLWELGVHHDMKAKDMDLAKNYKYFTLLTPEGKKKYEIPEDGFSFKNIRLATDGYVVLWPNRIWSWAIFPEGKNLMAGGGKSFGLPHLEVGYKVPSRLIKRGQVLSANLLLVITPPKDATTDSFAQYFKKVYLSPSWEVEVEGGELERKKFPLIIDFKKSQLELKFTSPRKLKAPVLVVVKGLERKWALLKRAKEERLLLIPYQGKVYFTLVKEREEIQLRKIFPYEWTRVIR